MQVFTEASGVLKFHPFPWEESTTFYVFGKAGSDYDKMTRAFKMQEYAEAIEVLNCYPVRN